MAERKVFTKQNDYVNDMRKQIYLLIADYTGQSIEKWSDDLFAMLVKGKDIVNIRPLTSALLILQQIVKKDQSVNAKQFWNSVIKYDDIMKHCPIPNKKDAFAKLLDFIRNAVHLGSIKSIDFDEKEHARKLKDIQIDAHVEEMHRLLRLRDGISDEQYERKFQQIDYTKSNLILAKFATNNEEKIKANQFFVAKRLFKFRDNILTVNTMDSKSHHSHFVKTITAFSSALKKKLTEEDFKYVTSITVKKPSELKLVLQNLKKHSPPYKPQHYAYVVYLLAKGSPEMVQYGLDQIVIKPLKTKQSIFNKDEQQKTHVSGPVSGKKLGKP